MMLKRRKREPMGVREPTVIRSPGHLAWVRGHECALQGKNWHQCAGKIEAAHVRTGTDGGTSMKPGDNWVLPLCSIGAHLHQHSIGEVAFEKLHGINMKDLAADLWRRSPHRLKYEAKHR